MGVELLLLLFKAVLGFDMTCAADSVGAEKLSILQNICHGKAYGW